MEEKKFELKNDNYVVLAGWMINELNLGGNELIVYAIIYQYSQDKNNWCYTSQEYLAEWIGTTTRTVRTIIDTLVSKNLIEKKVEYNEAGRFNIYKAHRNPLQGAEDISAWGSGSFQQGAENISPWGSGNNCRGVRKILQGGPENSSLYTIKENKEENKDNIKSGAKAPDPTKKRFMKPTVEEIKSYCMERRNNVDAQRFFDFYESKGWKVGNAQMKDWKAAVRTWENRSGYSGGYNAPPRNNCGSNNPAGFDEL